MVVGVPRVLRVVTCDAVGGTEHMVATLAERAARGAAGRVHAGHAFGLDAMVTAMGPLYRSLMSVR